MKCDKDGVPLVVQNVEHIGPDCWLDVTWFDGSVQRVDGQRIGLPLMHEGFRPMHPDEVPPRVEAWYELARTKLSEHYAQLKDSNV